MEKQIPAADALGIILEPISSMARISEGASFAIEGSRFFSVETLTALPKMRRDDVAYGASVAIAQGDIIEMACNLNLP